MTTIGVVGAAGRMGGAIIRAANNEPAVSVSTALERADSPALGQDSGVLAGVGENGVLVSADGAQADYAVLIDFSTPQATRANMAMCVEKGAAMVIGTTGMDEADLAALDEAAKKIPIMFAANMSVGVNVTLKLLELAAKSLGDSVDIEVVEAHHKHKVDAPSGTALRMGEVVADSLGKDLKTDGVFARDGIIGERPAGSIGFSTIRGGDIAGEHTVMFIGESERIEITHRATDRMIFANGAVRAAKWVAGQPAGRYDMSDVLGIR